jgi:ferredoxin
MTNMCCTNSSCGCSAPAAVFFERVSALNTLAFSAARCTGCGMCINVCPHGVFAPNGRAVQVVNADACMECGACVRNCPVGALQVDSGVGCAAAMIHAALTRRAEPTCCGPETGCCG